MSKLYVGEAGYLEFLSDVLKDGVDVLNNRTNHFCRTIFSARFKINAGDHFLVTHRSVPLRLAFEEFMFFLRGQTDTKILEEKGCMFWKGNTSREFLDSRSLNHLPTGSLGHAYSMQLRNAGGDFSDNNFNQLDGKGTDQLARLLYGLKNDTYGRRHIITLWNPVQESKMPLTSCWHTSQYCVLPNKDGKPTLHVKLINRSLDVTFGMLFAVQQYRLFQMMLCKMFGFELGELEADITMPHVYDNQLVYADEVTKRNIITKEEPAKIEIVKDLETYSDLISLEWTDIVIHGHIYNKEKFNTPRPEMVA